MRVRAWSDRAQRQRVRTVRRGRIQGRGRQSCVRPLRKWNILGLRGCEHLHRLPSALDLGVRERVSGVLRVQGRLFGAKQQRMPSLRGGQIF